MNIAFIPARGGSKSIPLKNIKEINGKPLIYWTLKAASDSSSVDKVILATDSDKIIEIANQFNISKLEIYKRKPENAQDSSSTESAMIEYINYADLSFDDIFFLIQATSPLLKSSDIDSMYKIFKENNYDSIFSGVREKQFKWIELDNEIRPVNYDYKNRPRRQDFRGLIAENGACYMNSVENILKDKCRLSGTIGIYEMPSYSLYELDEPSDWIIVENLMKQVLD